MPEAGETAGPARRRYLLLGAILFLASAYFYQDPEWNGNSRLDLTRAIVEQGTLTIDNYASQPQWETGDKAVFNGHYYSDKAIGSSLLAVPFYFALFRASNLLGIVLGSALIKHVLTTIIMGGAFTVAGLAMYWIAETLTGRAWKSMVSTLALAYGTMLWPYSAVYYGHLLAAAFLILAFAILVHLADEAGKPSAISLFVIGMAAGLAFISDYTAALIIFGLMAYAAYALRRRGIAGVARGAGIAVIGAMLPLAFAVAYNITVYGSVFASGYAHEAENVFAEGMSQGLLGIGRPSLATLYHITLDPQFGILWQSPIILLAPIGFLMALRSSRFRSEGIMCLYAALVMLAMNAGYYLWWGGSAFGPRLLIPALPFLIVPLALLPEVLLWLVGLFGVVSAGQMLIPLLGQIQPTLLVFRPRREMFYVADKPFTGFSLLYDYGVPQIARQYRAGQPAWTLGAALGLPYVLSIPALIVAEIGLIAVFRRTARLGGGAEAASRGPSKDSRASRPAST